MTKVGETHKAHSFQTTLPENLKHAIFRSLPTYCHVLMSRGIPFSGVIADAAVFHHFKASGDQSLAYLGTSLQDHVASM